MMLLKYYLLFYLNKCLFDKFLNTIIIKNEGGSVQKCFRGSEMFGSIKNIFNVIIII